VRPAARNAGSLVRRSAGKGPGHTFSTASQVDRLGLLEAAPWARPLDAAAVGDKVVKPGILQSDRMR
jgi:hypothetical protein